MQSNESPVGKEMKQSSDSNLVKSYSSKSYGLIYAGTVDWSFLIIVIAGKCYH
jgi:hypothetical protein